MRLQRLYQKLLIIIALVLTTSQTSAISLKDLNSAINDTVYFDETTTCGIDQSANTDNAATTGPVYVVGDSLTVGMQGNGLEAALTLKGWDPATVKGLVGRAVNAGPTPTAMEQVNQDQSAIAKAAAVVVELGTNAQDSDWAGAMKQLIQKVRAINSKAQLYWVNVGVLVSTKSLRDLYNARNTTIDKLAATENFKVIDWFRTVFPGGDPENAALNMTPQKTAGTPWLTPASPAHPTSNIHPTTDGYKAMANLVASSLVGQPGGGGSGSAMLDGHTLPATSGVAVQEDPYGKLPRAFPTNNPLEQKYFINMRWEAWAWSWNGGAGPKNLDATESDTSFFQKHPRVLVTDTTTSKSVVTAVVESGPRYDNSSGLAKPDWWDTAPGINSGGEHYVIGTPAEYKGWVAGLSPDTMKELGTTSASPYPTGSGDQLTFAWATDQSAQPGPTTQVANDPGSGGSMGLPSTVPEPYNHIFTAAAQKFQAPPAIVAAIFYAGEHGSSWPNPNGPWRSSSAGAQGPFQFLTGTWATYGYDGNGDGKKDIQNLTDAAYGAANMLSQNGAKIKNGQLPVEGVKQHDSNGKMTGVDPAESVRGTIWRYNLSETYNDNVWTAYTHFLKGAPKAGDTSTASCSDSQGAGGGSTQPCQGKDATSGNGLGTANVKGVDFTFPQCTNQNKIKNYQPAHWCYTSVTSCHGSYNAADIFNDTGTPVVAPVGGYIFDPTTWYGSDCLPGYSPCSDHVFIHGDDGRWYWLQHMYPKSMSSHWKAGMRIEAGQQVGVVGRSQDAISTASGSGTLQHTHMDITPNWPKYKDHPIWTRTRQIQCPASADQCELEDPQPFLVPSFNNLPVQ